jgi:hypothetical protein
MKRYIPTGAALGALLLVAACASTSPVVPTVESDAQLLVTGVAAAVAGVEAVTPPIIPAATATKINADLALARTALAELEAAANASAGTGAAADVVAGVEVVLSDLSAAPFAALIPPPYSGYVSAAQALLPVLAAEAAVALPASAKRAGVVISPDAARATLRAARG